VRALTSVRNSRSKATAIEPLSTILLAPRRIAAELPGGFLRLGVIVDVSLPVVFLFGVLVRSMSMCEARVVVLVGVAREEVHCLFLGPRVVSDVDMLLIVHDGWVNVLFGHWRLPLIGSGFLLASFPLQPVRHSRGGNPRTSPPNVGCFYPPRGAALQVPPMTAKMVRRRANTFRLQSLQAEK
jgi:hypothetical protein